MIKSYPNRTYDRLADPQTGDDVPKALRMRQDALDMDGIAAPGEKLENGMIFINKQSPTETSPRVGGSASEPVAIPYKSAPLTYKYPGEAVVDKVF